MIHTTPIIEALPPFDWSASILYLSDIFLTVASRCQMTAESGESQIAVLKGRPGRGRELTAAATMVGATGPPAP